MATYEINANQLLIDGLPVLKAVDKHQLLVLEDLCNYLKGLDFQGQKLIVAGNNVLDQSGKICFFVIGDISSILSLIIKYSKNSEELVTPHKALKSSEKEILILDSENIIFLSR